MSIMRKVVPGIAVVGISLVLAVGFDRALRLGSDVDSSAPITVAVASTPDKLAQAASVSGSTARSSSRASEPGASVPNAGCDPIVCESTAIGVKTGDSQRVRGKSIAIDASSGQLDPAFVIDTVSSASPWVGTVGNRLHSVPEAL